MRWNRFLAWGVLTLVVSSLVIVVTITGLWQDTLMEDMWSTIAQGTWLLGAAWTSWGLFRSARPYAGPPTGLRNALLATGVVAGAALTIVSLLPVSSLVADGLGPGKEEHNFLLGLSIAGASLGLALLVPSGYCLFGARTKPGAPT
jgi:hypothetical protein